MSSFRSLAISSTAARRTLCTIVFALVILCGRPSAAGPIDARTLTVPIGDDRVVHIDATMLFHTLVTDFFPRSDGTVYVETGDIPAMWLRDSSAQTLPYVRFVSGEAALALRVRGVIERNAKNVLTNSYANAFTAGFKIWEEKWEPDSLAYPVTLAWAYWQQTHDRAIFTRRLHWAFQHTLSTYACEQHHHECSHYTSRFLPNHGSGAEFAETGMIWAAFRPSDEPVRFPFNIPQQMLAAVALDELAELEEKGFGDQGQAAQARAMAAQIRDGINLYGRVYTKRYGWMYAYEVDGLGHTKFMDDANLPNLLSAPLFGFASPDDAVYQNTRRFVLSPANIYYYSGRYAEGIGSSHTPTGWVWPLAIIARALTSDSPADVQNAISQLVAIDGTHGLIHESFDPNNPSRFTRPNFGWANAMYAELLFRSAAGLPGDEVDPEGLASLLRSGSQTPTLVPLIEQWQNAAAVTQALLAPVKI